MRSTGCGVWTGIEGIDACCTDNILVTQRNEGASIHAAARADEVLKAGDPFPLGLGVRTVAESRDRLLDWIGRLLCQFGFHDYRLIEVVGGFGAGGQVQKVECRRCGYVTTRSG